MSTAFAGPDDWLTLKAKVLDANTKQALIGAKIVIGEGHSVVYTDADGFFAVDVQEEWLNSIKIEYISYKTTQFSIEEMSEELIFELKSFH